jgi:hypothetical protein
MTHLAENGVRQHFHLAEVSHAAAHYLRECRLVSIRPLVQDGLHQAPIEVLCDRTSGADSVGRPPDLDGTLAQGTRSVQSGRALTLSSQVSLVGDLLGTTVAGPFPFATGALRPSRTSASTSSAGPTSWTSHGNLRDRLPDLR